MQFLRRYVAFFVVAVGCLIGSAAQAQPVQTPSGMNYPLSNPTGGIDLGYHRIGGMVSDTTGTYAGHFMSPGPQKIDFHTGKPGKYIDNKYHNGYDILSNAGQPVYTVADGWINTISLNGWTCGGTTNFGLVIEGFTGSNQHYQVVYGMIEKATSPYKNQSSVGAFVPAGTFLGYVGTSSQGNFLHFGVWVGDGNIPIDNKSDYQMIDIRRYWPSRLGWVDPVQFIESECTWNCPAETKKIHVARNDMEMGMVGKFRPTLTPQPYDLRWSSSDQYYDYYRNWFYVVESDGHTHWYEAETSFNKTDPTVRWWHYWDDDAKTFSPWVRVVVIR